MLARREGLAPSRGVPDKEQDAVFRIDPATGKVIDSFPAGDGAFAALNAFGSTWP
jgi:hypothetical protein